ncbi:MAG: UDP-3-O-(3-hydroxymyristoyl)glucosamine N-acyltransferase [bacterium]
MKLADLCRAVGGSLEGNGDVEIREACPLDECRDGCVTFVERRADAGKLTGRNAGAVICPNDLNLKGHNLVRAANPKLAFARALKVLYPPPEPQRGVHPSAHVHGTARLGENVSVGANSVIHPGAGIGNNTLIHPNVFIGENARIGADCVIHPTACVLRGCVLGDRVILHCGAVIGADGFGYAKDGERHSKIPQVGNVIIGNDVEIGAHSAVDRATLGATIIGDGTKIDNHVQIGHNVKIGKNCILCGQVGVAGSCEIGDGAVLAGQAGISDHVKIGARAIIGGQAGVISDVPDGAFYSGYPAAPHREAMRLLAALKRLPDIEKKLEALLNKQNGKRAD